MDRIVEFYQWLIAAGNNIEMRNFRAGYVWGVLATLVLLVLIKIVLYFLCGRNKKVSEIRIPGEGGSLFISTNAVSDMVKFVGAKFDYIDIVKVSLREGKYGFVMDINVSYDMHGERFPELTAELKTAIRENLDGRLGIDCIKDIDIHGKKITDKKNSRF